MPLVPISLALSAAVGALAAPADTTPAPANTPAVVVVHRQPALPLVALRMSLQADDPPGYAGAGHLFQHLLLPRLRDQVDRVGGRVSAERTAEAVVFTVIGPAEELPFLATTLRGALAPPPVGTAELLVALRQLGDEAAEERETADQYVRAALRARLFPAQLSAAGTTRSLQRLEVARLADVWAAMYAPERVAVSAVGAVQPEDVRRAFGVLPEPVGGAPLTTAVDSIPGFGGRQPEVSRGWVGVGYPLRDPNSAAVSIAARLLRDALQARYPRASVQVEHWWTREGQALAAVIAIPDLTITTAQLARVSPAPTLAALVEAVDDAAVSRTAAALRREMLFAGRAPEGMAETIGAFVDRTGELEAAQSFYDALGTASADDVRGVFTALSAAEAVRAIVPPQPLPEKP